jgi:hypothetical protein
MTTIEMKDKRLEQAWAAWTGVYEGEWGLKASEEDGAFAIMQALWPDRYADAKFATAMRDDQAVADAVDQIYHLNSGRDMWDGSDEDAERYIGEIVNILASKVEYHVGDRVKLIEYVDRFPFFQVAPDAEGTITECERNYLSVKMDDPIDGCEEWDNEIIFNLPEEAFEVVLCVEVIA